MSCNLAKLVPKGPLPELLAMSDEDKRKAKAREAARKHYLKRKAARAAGESAGILAVHKRPHLATDDRRGRFNAFIDRCDEGTREVLHKLFNDNDILDGVDVFGEDGNNEGFNNGLFSCLMCKPADSEGGRSEREWKLWSENAFIACMNAGIPLILKGDAPNVSPIGEMMRSAEDVHATRLGQIGRKSGTGLLTLNEKFTDRWRVGDVRTLDLANTLRGGTLTIDNTEVNKTTDRRSFITMKNDNVTKMIRERTRMGQLCFPLRRGYGGGILTGSLEGSQWGGSECMLFAKDGGMTNPHIDVQQVPGGTDEIVYMPAAGIIRTVNGADCDRPAKQAIVVHADDMGSVVKTLGIDISKESTRQYSGTIETLPDFARELRAASIRFVVMDFPARCSYALPAKCAHVFVTKGLVESAAWHPVFKQDMKCSV